MGEGRAAGLVRELAGRGVVDVEVTAILAHTAALTTARCSNVWSQLRRARRRCVFHCGRAGGTVADA